MNTFARPCVRVLSKALSVPVAAPSSSSMLVAPAQCTSRITSTWSTSRLYSTTPESVSDTSFADDTKEYASEMADIEAEYVNRKARRQALVGVVISNKMNKSITVDVRRPKYVDKYQKVIYKKRMFMAHDEEERCKPGDVVRIVPCRPMSRRKRHALIDVIKEGVSLKELEEASAAKAAASKEPIA